MPAPVIDWTVAEWVAGQIAGTGGPRELQPGEAARAGVGAIDLIALTDDAQRRVTAYTGLTPVAPIPTPEGVSRREWVASNIASTRQMLDPLLDRAADKLGPAKDTGRLLLGVVASAEVGLLVGYLAQRVMGQYELSLLDPPTDEAAGDVRDPRLLFVMPNLDEVIQRLDANEQEFITWVTLHEVTHAVQFGGVPWLRGYLAGLIRELTQSAEERMNLRRSLRLPSRAELTRMGKAVLNADMVGLVATERERATIDRAQAVMAVIEGHAEHVMDAVAPELLPSLPQLRAKLDQRRKRQRGLSKLVSKLLGMEMKLRQYEHGKVFCDALVDAAGPAALTQLFSGPEALPNLEEINQPALWLKRHGFQL